MYATPRDADRALLAFAKDIAAHLDGFTAGHDGTGVVLHDDTGVFLGVAFCGHPVGTRIAIAAYPPSAANDWQRKQLKSKITMVAERGAEVIAARITRDVLPGYLQVLAQVKADIADRTERLAARDILAARLEAIIPGAQIDNGHGPVGQLAAVTVGDRWQEPNPGHLAVSILISVDAGSVTIKGCDPILTMRIGEAIADFYDRHRLDTTDADGGPGRED